MLRRLGWIVAALALLATDPAISADFTQPKRDPEYIKSARRQDKELLKYWGRLIPGGTTFNHLGSYQVMVHRNGLLRPLTLIPVARLAYTDAEALRATARGGDVIVGAVKVAYGQHSPEIMPGTLLVAYDGQRVHLRNVHGENLASFDASITPTPPDARVDPAIGALADSSASLANVLPDGRMQVYLQLTSDTGRLLQASSRPGFSKVLLEFTIPGIITDDDSPQRTLVEPRVEDKRAQPARVYGQ